MDLLLGFLELDPCLLRLCGPSASARLSCCSLHLQGAVLPWLRPETWRHGIAPNLPQMAINGPLQVEALIEALSTACPELLAGDGQWLHLLQPICLGLDSAADAVILAAVHDAHLAAAAAVWVATLQKNALARLLLRLCNEVQLPPSLRRLLQVLDQRPSEEDFFEDILDGRLLRVILHLAQGVNVEATGPAIHRNDVGCCKWTPLTAAADIAARRKQGPVISNLLLVARADVNRTCPGPCGWTPLMRAALAGAPAESTLRLLVRAGADVRMRHENGNTALDMGDTTSAQAIRQARDQRVAKQQVANDHTQKKPKAKAAPNLLALANAGRARSSKGSGRGTRR